MDELNSNFGQLSTSAAEWKPGGVAGASSTRSAAVSDSDLNAGAVKEFVPGQGWVVEPQGE